MARTFECIPGTTYSSWTVLEKIPNTYRSVWRCKCSCGNTKNVLATYIVRGRIKSCGCGTGLAPQGRPRHDTPQNATYARLQAGYKNSARLRGFEFSLSEEEFKSLTSSNCAYCKTPPNAYTNRYRNKDGSPSATALRNKVSEIRIDAGAVLYNGIDRVDNSIGYIISNCVSCCRTCNRAKSDMSLESFRKWIKAAYEGLQ